MSTLLRFMAQSARQAEIRADLRGDSLLGATLVLKRSGPISRPVDLALKLKDFGMGLSEAHKILNRIVADETVTLRLGNADRIGVISALAELGVTAM